MVKKPEPKNVQVVCSKCKRKKVIFETMKDKWDICPTCIEKEKKDKEPKKAVVKNVQVVCSKCKRKKVIFETMKDKWDICPTCEAKNEDEGRGKVVSSGGKKDGEVQGQQRSGMVSRG